MFTIDELFSEQNEREALEHFSSKRDSRGPDGMQVSELEDYWRINRDNIIADIVKGVYEPVVIEHYEIMSGSGKRRTVSNMAVIDRFITRLLSQKLRCCLEPQFQNNSFAYQENKGIQEAVVCARVYIEQGNRYLTEVDLKNYFDEIPLEIIMELLRDIITDETVLTLLNKYLYCRIERDNVIEIKHKGLLQGSSISPVLSNLYLDSLDTYMENEQMNWIRFADNIYVFSADVQAATEIYNNLLNKIVIEYKIPINTGKR